MSNLIAIEDGEQQQFSLIKAVDDVSQHSYAQTETLKEKEKILRSLQVSLSDVEKKAEEAELKLRSKVRELLMLEGDVEHLKLRTRVLHDRCASVRVENTELQFRIIQEEESAGTALAGFNAYRKKMEDHRAAVLRAQSQTAAHKDLEERRAMLTQENEELGEDVENPNGNTLQAAKREVEALRGEIAEMRKNVDEGSELLRKEFETQAQIKKDIEIQNRRYEAIIKRLHCQLSKAQAAHRQMSGDIYYMERKVAELKLQLGSSKV